jgi:hypothetical protein
MAAISWSATEGVLMSDTTDTIVLLHGLWMTPRSWEKWAEWYEGRGGAAP